MLRWKILPETFRLSESSLGFGMDNVIPEPNPADQDDSLSETCSGEGESLMSFSDAELEDDYLFREYFDCPTFLSK